MEMSYFVLLIIILMLSSRLRAILIYAASGAAVGFIVAAAIWFLGLVFDFRVVWLFFKILMIIGAIIGVIYLFGWKSHGLKKNFFY